MMPVMLSGEGEEGVQCSGLFRNADIPFQKAFPPSLLPSFTTASVLLALFRRRRHFLHLAHSRRANWLFPSILGSSAPSHFAFPLKSLVRSRLRETHQTHPSAGMTDAHAKKGGCGGDATRVTGSNFRHDLADYNRASLSSFVLTAVFTRKTGRPVRHSRPPPAQASESGIKTVLRRADPS